MVTNNISCYTFEIALKLWTLLTGMRRLNHIPRFLQCIMFAVEVFHAGGINKAFYLHITLTLTEDVIQECLGNMLGDCQVMKLLLDLSLEVEKTA